MAMIEEDYDMSRMTIGAISLASLLSLAGSFEIGTPEDNAEYFRFEGINASGSSAPYSTGYELKVWIDDNGLEKRKEVTGTTSMYGDWSNALTAPNTNDPNTPPTGWWWGDDLPKDGVLRIYSGGGPSLDSVDISIKPSAGQ